MWHIVTDRQLQKFFNRAFQLGLEKGYVLGHALAQNKGTITGKPTKLEQDILEILNKKGE